MTIKVQCACGTKFAFDVEPQNGAMPFRVNCPSCNADGTDAANQIIAQALAAAAQPAQPRLRMQGAAPPASAAVPAPAEIPIPRPRGESAAVRKLKAEAHQTKVVGWVIAAVIVLALGAMAAWAWFAFVGSKPHLAYSMKLTGPESGWHMEFLEGGKILLAGPNRIIVHDIKTDKDAWSATLPSGKSGDDMMPAPPHVLADKQNIWVCSDGQLVRLDEKTGEVKQTTPIPGEFSSFTPTPSNILVVSAVGETRRIAMQVDRATGEVSSRDIDVPRSEKHEMPDQLPAIVAPTADVLLAQATEEHKFNKLLDAVSSEFISAGDNLVELRVRLIEPIITWVKSIKPRGPTLINGNLTASTSVGAVEEEVFNDIKRDKTGGVKGIDESKYEVRVRRWLGDRPVEWKNEVTGLPAFFALPTVDLLTAGKSLTVFDKQNNKLFDATLSYPIQDRFAKDNMDHVAPGAEKAGVLYFFDQGLLTAFSLPGGQVKWRLTSIGISQVQFDDEGMLYVDSTAAAPEDIQYSDQVKIEKTPAEILKVDPRTGKILWQVQKLGQRCVLSGKYVYTVSVNQGGVGLAVGLAEALRAPRPEGPMYFNIHRLDPETGAVLWTLHQDNAPEEEDFQQNWFVLRYGDDVQAWKFLTF